MDKDSKLPKSAAPRLDDTAVDDQQMTTRQPPAFQLTQHKSAGDDIGGPDFSWLIDGAEVAGDILDFLNPPANTKPEVKKSPPTWDEDLLEWMAKQIGTTTKSPDKDAIIPIDDLIKYVQDVESAYPADNRNQTITRIRQQYYSGMAFDFLIPGAPMRETVPAPPSKTPSTGPAPVGAPTTVTQDRKLDKDKLKTATWNHLTARADENGIQDNPSPYVLLKNGEKVDLGHMLLTLDALIHPSTSIPYSTYDVPNLDPASWVADLGIGAVWLEYHEKHNEAHSDVVGAVPKVDLDTYFKKSAPIEDLLGDVDGFGMMQAAKDNPTLPLSATLEAYYLGRKTTAAGINKRWQTFCTMNGLDFTTKDGKITWKSGIKDKWVDRINRFNDLYGDGKAKAAISALKFWETPAKRKWKHTPAVLNKFLDLVKVELEKELAAKP